MKSASLTGRSILLIEDEPLIAFDIRQALESEGAQVQIAHSLASASHLIQHNSFSAAIVDFVLSDGDAADIARARPRAAPPRPTTRARQSSPARDRPCRSYEAYRG
jgi:DNA-binding response OmpR family regulator